VPRMMQEVGFGSNYVVSTSNILVKRILSEDIFGSNYVLSTSNILVPRIMQEVGYTSNYVFRINSELTTAIGGKQVTVTSGNLISIFNSTQFENISSLIQIRGNWKPTTSVTEDRLTTSVNIANASFDGSSSISISYANLTYKPWQTPTPFYVNFDTAYTTKRVRIGTRAETDAALQITVNATIGATLRLEYTNNIPTFELIRSIDTAASLYNWSVYNDDNFKISSKNLATAYTDKLIISGEGNVSIGTTPTTNKLEVSGNTNISGSVIVVNGLDVRSTGGSDTNEIQLSNT